MASPRRRPDPASPKPPPITVVNGWSIYVHPLFLEQCEALLVEVERLRAVDPIRYRESRKTKLLAAIYKMAFEVIPKNPADRIFWQGNTLGADYRHWHRGKFFQGRYRLFFRYTTAGNAIVLAWVNDSDTLRTYGSKTDAYTVFKGMLDKRRPPDEWQSLLREAKEVSPRAKKLLNPGTRQ